MNLSKPPLVRGGESFPLIRGTKGVYNLLMTTPVEQIKARLNIVDVVGSYIRLQKAGINLKASCPFHKEKTPSFFVSPSRESWHCFGCNRGGDIFNFVMEIEGVEFPDALKILANRAGVELKPISQEFRSERGRLLSLTEEAKSFYAKELEKNKKVSDYLKDRGLKETAIKEFNIGFAPEGWRNLRIYLKTKGYKDEEMEKAGLVIKKSLVAGSQPSDYYDRFRNRIMFPINNSAGQTVGFSGRIFGEETETTGGKYINTPQTVLYDKSKILFAFDKAKTEIRKNDACVLVEGNMDAIMSHQAGVKNTVAVSGTALTAEHLGIIKRLTDNLLMAFDKDDAGFSASKRGIDMALKEGFDVKAIEISSGKDPADVIRDNPENWKKSVETAKNVIDFYLRALAEKIKEPRDLQKKIRELVLPYVVLMPNEMEKAHWIKEIARMLKIKEEPIWEEARKINPNLGNDDFQFVRQEEAPKTRLKLLRELLIGFILWHKGSEDGDLKNFISECCEKYSLEFDENGEEEKKFVFSAEMCYSNLTSPKEELRKLAVELEKEEIKFEQEKIAQKIRQTEFSEKEEGLSEYLNKLNELNRKLRNLPKI